MRTPASKDNLHFLHRIFLFLKKEFFHVLTSVEPLWLRSTISFTFLLTPSQLTVFYLPFLRCLARAALSEFGLWATCPPNPPLNLYLYRSIYDITTSPEPVSSPELCFKLSRKVAQFTPSTLTPFTL